MDRVVVVFKRGDRKLASPAVVDQRRHRRLAPFGLARGPVEQYRRDHLVTVDEHIGFDRQGFPDRPLDRKPASIDLRFDALDHGARTTLLGESHRDNDLRLEQRPGMDVLVRGVLANSMPIRSSAQMPNASLFEFDVAVVGGGPAGLSAAITLGRARRRVVVFDHGKPRNFAARAVHCFLGLDGLSPGELRERGRNEACAYGVTFVDGEVTAAHCLANDNSQLTAFAIVTATRVTHVRSLLLATGMIDRLPEIPGVEKEYGRIVHHCPYCDGYEHRDQSLIALGSAESAPKLGAMLLAWSNDVTVCTNGEELPETAKVKLSRLGIAYHEARITKLEGQSKAICFDDGTHISCEALFFSSGQSQKSDLFSMLGCQRDEEGLVVTQKKQCTSVCGVYLAGDADGDVQFAVVAAAEGAIAATAIHQDLLDQDQAC